MIDFHVHSTASDGTVEPEELAKMGLSFGAMALTDHDNMGGVARFLAESERLGAGGIRLAGVELSVEPGEGYRQLHMLGLGVDPESPALEMFLARIREGRVERNREMCAKLARMGYAFEESELQKYAGGEVVARPHIARVMMDHGWVASVQEAFERFLQTGAPAYVPRRRPSQNEAIAAIHEAGGIAVLAHPRYWTDDQARLRLGLARLGEMGLDGVEAVYQANAPEETVDHLRAAKEAGLVVTAGSDFHGANKPSVKLGMSVADEDSFLAPVVEALKSRRSFSAAVPE